MIAPRSAVVGFAVAVVLACADAAPGTVGVIESVVDDRIIADGDRVCAASSECVVVAADCCGCGGGGRATAIRRDARDGVDARRGDSCVGVSCVDGLEEGPTCCAQQAACVDGRCELFGVRGVKQSQRCRLPQ